MEDDGAQKQIKHTFLGMVFRGSLVVIHSGWALHSTRFVRIQRQVVLGQFDILDDPYYVELAGWGFLQVCFNDCI